MNMHINKKKILLLLCFSMLLAGCTGKKTTETTVSTADQTVEGTTTQVGTATLSNETASSGISMPTNETTSSGVSMPTNETTSSDTPMPSNAATTSGTTAATASAEKSANTITLGFAGDMNLDENWATTCYLNQQENGIYDCIDQEIIEDMKSCSLFMLNNEFTYSTRGTPMAGKAYTFRANPDRIGILKEMGVDIVLLANNHVYDYGKDAFLDTLDTLEQSEIQYVGAGRNYQEACRIVYEEVEGVRIAYVAASRAEKNKMTPQATESEPGILRTYDPTAFLALVQEADKNSDFVIANVHWGTEYSNDYNEIQKSLGHALAESGADLVIGTHPHVLQGVEIYQNVPIFYSLGNFWFNEKNLYSGYLKVEIDSENASIKKLSFVPCVQQNCMTRLTKDENEKIEILSFMETVSDHVKIDKDGTVKYVAQ